MNYCPLCGTLLQIQPATGGNRLSFFCPTCPFVSPIKNKIVKKARLIKKEVEDIFCEDDTKHLAKKTSETCPACYHGEAYFFEMQTRSADEPMTKFLNCCKCGYKWKED